MKQRELPVFIQYGGAELIAIASDSSHDLSLLYFDLFILFL